jgi:uncharacterized protein YggU (UPF0235/DUF167 family)
MKSLVKMMETWAKDHEVNGEAGTLLFLYVQPGFSKTAWMGEFESTPPRLKLSISAAPTELAANEVVMKFLAETLGVAKSRVHLLSGDTSRQKDIWISAIDVMSVVVRLNEY